MKELSIEEKAKRYDEAIERARTEYKNHEAFKGFCEMLVNIFPELKESGDEQIRKELLEHCINRRDGKQVCVDANDYRRWADWLEKQGQSKKTSIWKHWKDGIAGSGEGIPAFLIKKGLTYSLSPYLSFECDYIELSELDSFMLEKQGEQKSINIDFKAKDCYVSKVDGKIHITGKFEPKFKVGDFIVNDYCRGKVVELTDDAYLLDTGQGIPFSCEHNIHLWTIKDAKDGDVLASKYGQSILIFKNLDTKISFSSHYNIEHRGELGWSAKSFIPATKEQRDTLFARMKEEGYEWNADTKELIKLLMHSSKN